MHIQNNNNIHIQISDSLPQFVRGHSVQLSQVLMNLIGNACKFTENGDISVIADTTKYDDNKGEISFQVKDTGLGIPFEKQDSIFEEFSQIDSHGYKYQGTGLGLPIVKKLLKMVDSDISLTSIPGVGSTFSFILKFDFINEIEDYRASNILDVESLSGKRVLIVEDNRINQTVTKKILENNDAVSVVVEDGQEAVDIMNKEKFDLVLMDIHMPVMNGIDATIAIREFNNETPIVALTAVEIEEMRHEIYESGMNDIIVKPYDVTKFMQIILKNVNNKGPLVFQNSKQAI